VRNTRLVPPQTSTGAAREGFALLQGLATCGTCGRKLAVHYQGKAQGHKQDPPGRGPGRSDSLRRMAHGARRVAGRELPQQD